MEQRTDTASEAPAFAFEQGRSRRDRRRRRRRVRALVAVAALAVGVLGAFAADVVAFRGRVHTGVQLAGIDLGGLTVAQATGRLREAAADLGDDRLVFRLDEQRFETTPDALGWRPDVDATVERALAIGRSGPPWRDAATRAVTWIRPTRISWVSAWDEASAQAVVRTWTDEVGAAPREGRVFVREGAVIERNPVPGRRIAVDQLFELAGAAVEGRTGRTFRLPVLPREPRTSPEDVSAAADVVRTIVSGPVEVVVGELELTFGPEELGPLVRSRVVDEGAGASIEIVFPPARVDELLAPIRDDVEVASSSARLTVSGGRVVVAETSRNGRRLDPERAARRLLAIATSPSRAGRIPLVVAKPELTTRQAKALGIRERISAFTTHHAAGEPRVTNIHLAADILDGAIVMPGEEFSLNGRVGERTADRGFVEAPVIYEGQFTTDIGGGTSQLATTTFNAAFFAGFPFVEYQPHSYYISRYPMGREATVSYPKPDLRFVNDVDRPVLIVTSYTGSSITVEVWGRGQGRTVTATEPQVTSRSSGGFTVVVHRIVTQGDREVRRDTFTTFYRYG